MAREIIKRAEVIKKIREMIQHKYGTNKAASKEWGKTPRWVSSILTTKEDKAIPVFMLNEINFKANDRTYSKREGGGKWGDGVTDKFVLSTKDGVIAYTGEKPIYPIRVEIGTSVDIKMDYSEKEE